MGCATSKQVPVGVIDAKTWSKMIDKKILRIDPKTPVTTTPPWEPEMINAWELMEGFDDTSPLRPKIDMCSFSFHVNPNKFMLSLDDEPENEILEKTRKYWFIDSNSNSNSVFNSVDTSVSSEFDTDVINEFRNSLNLFYSLDGLR
nr:glutaredoxin-related protein [Tanacetum cinerariifolium]